MKRTTRNHIGRRTGVAIALIATLGLAGCGGDGDGDGDGAAPPVENPVPTQTTAPSDDADANGTYEGAYDAKFREWAGNHEGATVTLTGTVKNVVNDNAFTLAGENGADDFLVVSKDATSALAAGGKVSVTGVVHKAFDLPGVEDEINIDFSDDDMFEGFDRDPYVVASNITTE